MKKRGIIPALAAVFAVLGIVLLVMSLWREQVPERPVTKENTGNVGTLLADLVTAYVYPNEDNERKLEEDLERIRSVDERDYELSKSIADHWSKVYLAPDYRLNLYHGEEKAELSELPDSDAHAIVVLGYALHNGEMQPELVGRCDAAAALARSLPNAILVCSGGATGDNNPDQHTEAGLMKEYLANNCGIDESRILTDNRAMTTRDNAVNTMEILREHGVKSMTIVTSAYHQRWGQAVYHAAAELCRRQYGYAPEILSNYCYDIEPGKAAFRNDAQIAAHQIAEILELPSDAVGALPPSAPPAEETGTAAEPAPEKSGLPENAAEETSASSEVNSEQNETGIQKENETQNQDPVPDAAPEEVPVPLDFGEGDNWAYFAEGKDTGVDIFLVCPTVDTQSERNALNLNEKLKRNFINALNMEKGIYEESGRLFSPYYRQMSINAYMLPEEEREQAAELAYADVAAAFRWYLDHENDGRGIILAGFSQGAEMCLNLMKEFYGGESAEARELRDGLVAVYALGWYLTEEMTQQYPQIVPAGAEADTGTVICFDCEDGTLNGTITLPEGVRSLSINPLNWETDSTPADRSLNLGAVMGIGADPVPGLCGACLGERGELIVTDVTPDEFPPVLDVFPRGAYHLYDYMFFFTNLKNNVAARTEVWLSEQTPRPARTDAEISLAA